MSLSIEIHVPASPTSRFATMLFFLANSLAGNANLPGPWKLVVALGRDGGLTPDSPQFSWTRRFPIEFRVADPVLWDVFAAEGRRRNRSDYVHNATVLRQLEQPYEADVVLFLDADTVMVGSLAHIIAEVGERDLFAAKPAWQPPDVDLDALLEQAGLRYLGPPIVYSGYGWSFVEPRFAPPYFNSGVTICSNRVANLLHQELAADVAWVDARYAGRYSWQIGQCIVLVRNGVACLSLDERYNLGIGEPSPSILTGDEGACLDVLGDEQARDARVIHYCTRGRHFIRERTMGDDRAMRDFLDATDLGAGERLLQAALLPFRDVWEQRSESLANAS